MPIYEYVCMVCKKEFTVILSFSEYEAKPEVTCPHCGNDHVERRLSTFFAKTAKKS